jgi:hypothetical protein
MTRKNKVNPSETLSRLKQTGAWLCLFSGRLFRNVLLSARHSSRNDGRKLPELENTRCILVTYSAFIDYLVVKADKAGIRL